MMHVRRLDLRALALAGLLALAAAPAPAANTAPSDDLPDLAAVKALVYSGDYQAAADRLLDLSKTVHHADVYNLLGFSLRKLGRYDEAARWYREALTYDPEHRPALEYQGELFIALGDFAAARKNLRYLEILCGAAGCVEYDLLKQALAAAGQTG